MFVCVLGRVLCEAPIKSRRGHILELTLQAIVNCPIYMQDENQIQVLFKNSMLL